MKFITALFLTLACISPAALADAQEDDFGEIREFDTKPLTRAIVEQLRKGGYVLYMRHGNTDTTKPDQIDADINDCATQRPLSQEGKRIVTSIGKIIRKAKIPVGEIHSSPMCRAKDSALLAFGKTGSLNAGLMYTANMTDKQKFQALDTIRELVSMQVSGHTNRAIVAHSQNIMALIGYLPSPEGTVVIFEPLGNHQFKYIASVNPKEWAELLP